MSSVSLRCVSFFAFLLAYASDARLLLVAGIICISAYLSAKTGTWSGCYWINFGDRPENFFPAAFLLFMVPLLPHNKFSGFAVIYRVFAMLLFFIPVLILSNWGMISYLNSSKETSTGTWFYVKTSDGKTGWVFSKYLKELGGAENAGN